MSAAEKSTVASRLKGKDAEPYKPEESLRFHGRKRTFTESEEYLAYSPTEPLNQLPVQPRKIRPPSSSLHGLKTKSLPQRMTKSGPVDSPNNPFVSKLAPKKVGESSSTKFVLGPAEFTPVPETSIPEPEPKQVSDTVEMDSESRKGMPNRRDNKAPSYDRNRPEELLRYIEDVEKELTRARVTVEQDKKDWLRHYADQRSSDEWTVLETYPSGKGSFADFKEELVSHYPEATDSLEGSIARLDKLCAKSTPLTSEHLSVVLEFIRSFKFEGRKLLRGGCISNREIVTKFLNCLDPELKKTVTWQMSQKTLNEVSPSDEERRKARHRTDPIEFETLLKVSEDLVRSFDSYNTITSGTPVKSATRTQHTILQRPVESLVPSGTHDRMVQLLEDMNESMAKNTDVLISMAKENSQRHGETTKSIETMHTLMNTWHKGGGDRPYNPPYPAASNQAPMRREGCHYCWIVGHFIADCQSLAADVTEGKLEAQDNGSRVDFKQFPKEPRNVSPRERVDLAWKNRKQFTVDDFPEDSFVTLTPTQTSVTLQSNWNGRDSKKDDLISELKEKARRATEERDMWKVTASRQANMSVPTAPQMPQVVPQPVAQSSQTAVDPKSAEFMTMLARMMSLAANPESMEKGFPAAQ